MYKKIIIIYCIALLVLFSANLKADTDNANKRTNVIIILSDDQGYGDFSCHGNPVLETPNLDRLYNESVRFNNFHVTPVCAPTRGQLMTGLDAMNNKACMVPSGRNLMRRDIITMPEVFRQNGYQTGIFGKWHLGDNYPDRPMDKGFQKCIWFKGHGLASSIEFDNDYYQTRYLDSLETKFAGKYCTNLWFDEAIKWMNEMCKSKRPFFTYLALNAPHGPLYSPEEDYRFYRNNGLDSTTSAFYGMIRNIDQNMNRLDKWLKMKKIKENTLVIFMNDNGGTHGVKVFIAEMRGTKGSNYDGGHRAACFIRWPEGNFGNPRTVHCASEIQDLLPTFVDLFALKTDTTIKYDGQSLKPVLTQNNEPPGERMFVVQYGGRLRPEKYFSCVVFDSWRLVGKNELYDLSRDPGQKNNVAGKYPDVLIKMKTYYDNWWKDVAHGIDNIIPVVVGSEKENPVILTSNNWIGVDVDNQRRVALAEGSPRGGTMNIEVQESSKYLIELSRWPFHLNLKLAGFGPDTTIGGSKIIRGKAVPIEYGCFALNSNEPIIVKSFPDATRIKIELDFSAGENSFQAWFRDINGKDLCGAYYVRLQKIF